MAFYEAIAESLRKHGNSSDILTSISDILKNVNEGRPYPFIVIDAPSGSGKTQLPFTLKHYGLEVKHLVMKPAAGYVSSQSIYLAFENDSA